MVLLSEEKWNEVAQVHGLRGWPTASVEEERLLLLVALQDGVHVSEWDTHTHTHTHTRMHIHMMWEIPQE